MYNLIIQCGNKKQNVATKVEEMYLGTFWNVYRNNKPKINHNVYVLSALYGLKKGSEIIKPYNKKFTSSNYKQMIPTIKKQIKQNQITKCYFVGSSLYLKVLRECGLKPIHITLGNNGIGYAAKALKRFLRREHE